MLEKILKEIDKLYSAKFASWSEPIIAIRDAREIIIAHMDDDKWVPVPGPLPETEGGWAHVLVSMDDGFVATTDYTVDDGFELWVDSGEIVAWMPLPEPYSPSEATKEACNDRQ